MISDGDPCVILHQPVVLVGVCKSALFPEFVLTTSVSDVGRIWLQLCLACFLRSFVFVF